MALRIVKTPAGDMWLPEEQAASYGLPPLEPPTGIAPPVEEFAAPALPPPVDTTGALAPLNDALIGPADQDQAPQLTDGLGASGLVPSPLEPTTDDQIELDAPAPQGAPPAPVAEAPPAPEQRPLDLSAITHGDVLGETNRALSGEQEAIRQAGDVEAARADAQAQAMAQNLAAQAEQRQRMEVEAAEDAKRVAAVEQKFDAAMEEHANFKIDRSMHRSTTNSVLTALSIAIAGFGSALKGQGDKNPALDIVMGYARQHVEDQYRERDALKDKIGLTRDRLGIVQQAATNKAAQRQLAFAATLDQQEREIAAMSAKFDSPAKKAAAEQLAAQVGVKKAEALGAAKQMQAADDKAAAALAQQERESRRSAGVQYARIAEDKRQADRGFTEGKRQFDATNQRYYDMAALDAEKEVAKLTAAGKTEEAKLAAASAKEERELAVGGGMLLKGGTGSPTGTKLVNGVYRAMGVDHREANPVFDESGRLLQKDGTLFKAPDLVSAQKLRSQVGATVTAANLLDEMVRLRNDKGWSSDLLKSDEWRTLKSNMGAVILEAKNAGELGALSGPDMELVQSILGTSDPTEFRDPTPGLLQARKNMVLKAKNTLRVAGYTGDFEVPDRAREEKAPRDRDVSAFASEGGGKNIYSGIAATMERGGIGAVASGRDGKSLLTGEASDPGRVDDARKGLTRDQALGRDALVDRTRKGGADGVKAARGLLAIAGDVALPQHVRDEAASTLYGLAAEGVPAANLMLERVKEAKGRRAP